MADSIRLKWGSLKGWNVESEKAVEIIRRYLDDGVNISAMAHRDTDNQKALILELIDAVEETGGTLYLDWDGKYVDAAGARDYVNNYDG